MQKIIRKILILAMVLVMTLSLAATASAQQPTSWLADLLAWYLAQNGVRVVVLFPGFNPHDTFGSTPTFEVFAGFNEHFLTNMIFNNDGELVGFSETMDRHYGIFYLIPGGTEGLGIEYAFIRDMEMPVNNPRTPYPYTNGLANGSDPWAGLTIGSETIGTLAWMGPAGDLWSENGSLKITFDFWYQGWRYGVVVDNWVYEMDEGFLAFWGIYAGARSNVNAPMTRWGYVNR